MNYSSPFLKLAVFLQALGILIFLIPKTYKSSIDLKEYEYNLEILHESQYTEEEEEEEEMGPSTFLEKLNAVFTIEQKPVDKKKSFLITDIAVSITLSTICIVVMILVSLSGGAALVGS